MSATNELIQTVYEFRSLLRYLGENYPKILKEWSNGPLQATTNSNHPTNEPRRQEDEVSSKF